MSLWNKVKSLFNKEKVYVANNKEEWENRKRELAGDNYLAIQEKNKLEGKLCQDRNNEVVSFYSKREELKKEIYIKKVETLYERSKKLYYETRTELPVYNRMPSEIYIG